MFEHQGKEWDCARFFEEVNRTIQDRKKTKGGLNFKEFWKEISCDEHNKEKTIKNRQSTKREKTESLLNYYKLILDYVKFMDPKGDFENFDKLLQQERYPSDSALENLKDELSLMALELTVEKYFWNPVFITDFPLTLSPLTKKHRKNSRLVERFEPYIAGMEIGNAYTELNDSVDQRQRLEKQERYTEKLKREDGGKTKRNLGVSEKENITQTFSEGENNENLSHPIDENFLHALEVGMPPTGGVGLGIERLVMILTNQSNIRDSILFPVLRDKPK